MKTNLLKAALFTPISGGRWGLPLIAWSNPGEAKTSVIKQLAKSFELPCVVLSPGEQGEGAFGVVPVPDGRVLRYPPPEWADEVKEFGLVFIDEMSSTPPALQPPLLGLLFERRIGGAQLAPRVRVIGAANPPEVAAAGFELAPPVANRCGHIDWSAPTPEEHASYLMRGADETGEVTDAAREEARVLSLWPDAWAFAVGLETAFLIRRPGLKNQCPKVADPKASRAWPSDRSWEMATRALASSRVHGLSDVDRDEFVASFVGAAAASEFMNFVQDMDLPDPAQLLDGKIKFHHSPKRLDRTAAVLNACVSIVIPQKAEKREERAAALWNLFATLHAELKDKGGVDVLVAPVQAMVTAPLMKGASKVLSAIQPLLRAAKIGPNK